MAHLPSNCDLTNHLPLDARLYAAPPEHRPGTRGRPRKRRECLPSPQQMLEQQQPRHPTLKLHGRQDKVREVEAVAYWYAVPQRPLKVVVVAPLTGGRPVQAFYSIVTDSPPRGAEGYAGRWSIEEAFQGSKSHLGFEEPQGWNCQAVRRTAPLTMILYSLTVLRLVQEVQTLYKPPMRPWHRHKVRPSFADMLTTLRYACLNAAISTSPKTNKAEQNLLLLLPGALRAAA